MYRRQYGNAARVLITVLGVLCFLSVNGIAGSSSTISPYVYFPENERFGYVTVDCPISSEKSACYQIVARPDAASASRPMVFPQLFTSLLPPRMCDTNAVSIISPGTERDYLIVVTFASAFVIDTVFEFNPGRMRSRDNIVFPDTCVFTPNNYFYLSNSRLLANVTTFYWTGLEIVKVIDRRQYVRIHSETIWGIGMASDFSQLLFLPDYGAASPLIPAIPIFAYDLKLDTVILLFEDEAIRNPLRQRTQQGPIYCGFWSETPNGFNLCRIKGDSLLVLTDFSEPIQLSGFELYADSIVVFHQRYCDAEYGTRRLVIRE